MTQPKTIFYTVSDGHDQVRLAYAPASVLTDASYNLLHSTLQSEVYLRFASGTPSQNVLELVRPYRGWLVIVFVSGGCSVLSPYSHLYSIPVPTDPESLKLIMPPWQIILVSIIKLARSGCLRSRYCSVLSIQVDTLE